MDNLDFHSRQNKVLKKETSDKIIKTSILVIGAGAGGNEILKNLALMGFGKFTIVDFDHIESSNLSRTTLFKKEDIGKSKAEVASIRLKEYVLHPSPEIEFYHAKIQDIGKKIFIDHDIIITCVDVNYARGYINDWCVVLQKPMFEMGFYKFNVEVSFFTNQREDEPCLRELIGQGALVSNRNSCSGLKMKDKTFSFIPTIQGSSAMAGVLIATELIKYLEGNCSIENKILNYNGLRQNIEILNIQKNPECSIHEKRRIKLTKLKITNSTTVKVFLELINKKLNGSFVIKFPEQFIISLNCYNCNSEIEFYKYKPNILHENQWCEKCQEKNELNTNYSETWSILNELHLKNVQHEKYFNHKLEQFGFNSNDIMTVFNTQKYGIT